jgi:predicted transcriptional regulator
MAPALLINSDNLTSVSAQLSPEDTSLMVDTSPEVLLDEQINMLQMEISLLRTSLSQVAAENRSIVSALEMRLLEMNDRQEQADREIASLRRQFRNLKLIAAPAETIPKPSTVHLRFRMLSDTSARVKYLDQKKRVAISEI